MAPFAVGRDQRLEHLHAVDDAFEIDVDDPVPVVFGDLSERPARGDAGVVADQVHLAEGGQRHVGGGAQGGAAGYVGDHALDADLLAGQRLARRLQRVRIDVGDDDV